MKLAEAVRKNKKLNEAPQSNLQRAALRALFDSFIDFAERDSFDSILGDSLNDWTVTDYKIKSGPKQILVTLCRSDDDGYADESTESKVTMSFS